MLIPDSAFVELCYNRFSALVPPCFPFGQEAP
jgi:hypothetical protein